MNNPMLLLMAGLLVVALAIVWGLGIYVSVNVARRQRRRVGRWVLVATFAGPILLGTGYLAHSYGRSVLRWAAAQAISLVAFGVLGLEALQKALGFSPILDLMFLLLWVFAALAPLAILGALGPRRVETQGQAEEETLVGASKLHKSYRLGRRELRVLRGVSLSVKRGEFVAILGVSGSGKSTLLHVLGLLDNPDSGVLVLDGADAAKLTPVERDRLRCRDIGFVFQFYHLLPELTVLENTMLPAMTATGPFRWPTERKRIRRSAMEILDRLGLTERLDHMPGELSGGEQQRVAIARALMNAPKILLADEPTGNLDSVTGMQIVELLKDLNERTGQTIIMVTHDQSLARQADRILHLRDGRLK